MDAMDAFELLEYAAKVDKSVRYAAVRSRGEVWMWSRPDLANASDSESDRYEELLVNPTLLLLVKQRGQIDCGGMDYVIIRYGNFFQVVKEIDPETHISLAVGIDGDLIRVANRMSEVLATRT
ncbi:hypothetical protein [Streptomyces werraensis]|uniref:hypothetical protein n=1 Tax=Streptomyces werraensis TaxID=68284 RepID=UPI001CE280AA